MMKNQTKLFSVMLFLILWQAISLLANSDLFPSLIDIVKSLNEHIKNKELFLNLAITLYRVFIAFFITMFIGIFFGLLMGFYRRIDDLLDFFLVLGLNIPALVTIIICYIWFGLSDFAAIMAVVINKVPIVIVNIREGTKAFDKKYMDLAKVYKLSKKEILTKIYLPQLYPYLMATTRLSLSLIWKIVLVVELLGRSDGIGFQISMFYQYFDISSILAYSLTFILVILLIEHKILKPIDNRLRVWK
ncbi:ABC transporter permease [Arcobacter sp.]|uniref:ABC transporter permease n=2 Tax=Arcobacter sp. TaxID=1872629 RepID=UPI003D0CA1A7